MKDDMGLRPYPAFPAFKLAFLTADNNPGRSLLKLRRALRTSLTRTFGTERSKARWIEILSWLHLFLLEA